MAKHQGFMEMGLVKKLVNEIKSNLPVTVVPFFRGEPLLHPQFDEILRLIPSKQVNETVAFDTNCQMLTPEISEAIIERCRDCKLYIFLSLDGITDPTYNSMRCGGNRELAYKNVHYLLRRRKEEKLQFPKVRIQFIVHENNHHEAEKFIEYWRSFDYWDELPIMDYIQDDRDFIHLRRWITGQKQDVADKLYDELLMRLGIKREAMPSNVDLRDCHLGNFPCENLFAMPMIRANGDVTVCNNDVELSLKVGNVMEQSFVDIWTGDKINKLRYSHLFNNRNGIKKCVECGSAQRTYFPESMKMMEELLK
jgi:radical SAM protein with 4Fe4S-binding SPASM domain